MLLQDFFTEPDLIRLFLTYKNNRANFDTIKDKLFPNDQSTKLKQNKRTSLIFFICVTFIILVSSSFSIMADHWDSFGALMIIWVVFTIGVCIWYYLTIQRTTQIHLKNKAFIQQFILVAESSSSAESFIEAWQVPVS